LGEFTGENADKKERNGLCASTTKDDKIKLFVAAFSDDSSSQASSTYGCFYPDGEMCTVVRSFLSTAGDIVFRRIKQAMNVIDGENDIKKE
jgi:hypothetical protein